MAAQHEALAGGGGLAVEGLERHGQGAPAEAAVSSGGLRRWADRARGRGHPHGPAQLPNRPPPGSTRCVAGNLGQCGPRRADGSPKTALPRTLAPSPVACPMVTCGKLRLAAQSRACLVPWKATYMAMGVWPTMYLRQGGRARRKGVRRPPPAPRLVPCCPTALQRLPAADEARTGWKTCNVPLKVTCFIVRAHLCPAASCMVTPVSGCLSPSSDDSRRTASCMPAAPRA
jgi:hypothetical protein